MNVSESLRSIVARYSGTPKMVRAIIFKGFALAEFPSSTPKSRLGVSNLDVRLISDS